MKRMRKLTALVCFIMAVTAASATAMAAQPAGGYVPVNGEKFLEKDGNWVPVGSISATYKDDGKCTSFSSTDSTGLRRSETYTWKGNYITKAFCDYRDSGKLQYKYNKKHKLVYRTVGRKKYTYKWNGKTAAYKDANYKENLTFNKKGQLTKAVYFTSKYNYKYYKNGNIKSITGNISTTKFNSRGDITSFSYKLGNVKATFDYVTDSSGKIEQVNVAYTDRTGSHKAKIVYKNWQEVSHVRNCDAAGTSASYQMNTDLLSLGSLFR